MGSELNRGLCGLLFVALGCAGGSGGDDGTAAGSTSTSGTTGPGGGSSEDGSGSDGAVDGTTSSSDDTTGGDPPVTPSGMPVGIPEPSFGYLLDTDLPPTVFVDNTNPSCDNAGGSEDAPLCDLFAGGSAASFEAGAVVAISGGPYVIDGDRSLTFGGTEAAPAIVKGIGDTKILFDAQGNRADFDYGGSYGVLENIEFFDNTRHGIASDSDHLVFRAIEIHNPKGAFIDFNPVVAVGGQDILIYESMIYDNRRMNDTDTHGINAGSGSANIWILDNELYNNNGDSFQGCHECFASPPHHVYIGRNVMHEDRENAVDLKTIHDVVVSENLMYGYSGSGTSSGDAMVIGSNGYVEATGQGPRNVWVLNNEFRDSATGIRIEGVQDAWVIGNVFQSLSTGLQIDDKEYRDIVIAGNVMDGLDAGVFSWNGSCSAESIVVQNNLVTNVAGHHFEFADCPNLTLANNLMWNAGGAISVRVAGPPHTDVASLNGEAFASDNLQADPNYVPDTLQPAADSPAVDAGVDLEPYDLAVEAAYGGEAHRDVEGMPRPAGAVSDIGAYEQ
ncbi:MAG: right-handed parallel beta-helix repeat-containing protein [Myxococcota bacterium]